MFLAFLGKKKKKERNIMTSGSVREAMPGTQNGAEV